MSTAGPNCGSRRRPTMSSSPGGTIGSTSSPRTVRPRRRAVSNSVRAAPYTASSPRSPTATPPTSDLWVSPAASSLSATGRSIRRATATAVAASGTGIASTTVIPAPATSARLSRSDRATAGRAAGRVGLGSAPYDVRSLARAPQSGPPWTALDPRGMSCLPAGDLGDRPERLERAAQERGTATDGVEQRLRLRRWLARGQRHVDGQDGGAVRGGREEPAGDLVGRRDL